MRNAASPRSISSHDSASETKSSPAPPYSSGIDDAEEAELGHALDQLEVELVVDVVLDRDRQDALVDERADGLLDQPLLVGEREVHRLGRAALQKAVSIVRKNQSALVHQTTSSTVKVSPPASGRTRSGKRLSFTIVTFAT